MWTQSAVRPQTQTYPLAVAQTMDIDMTSHASTDHLYQYAPHTSIAACPMDSNMAEGAAQSMGICMIFGGNVGHRHPCEPRVSTCPEQWTKDTKVASGVSMDHGGLLRRSNPENETFFISDILPLLRTRVILRLGSLFSQRLSLFNLQATWLTPLSNMFSPLPSTTAVTILSLSFTPFHHTLTVPFLYLSHFSIKYSFVIVA